MSENGVECWHGTHGAHNVPNCRGCGHVNAVYNHLHNSAGFEETKENEYPVEVTVYTRTHMEKGANTFVRISNVREDSITVEVRKGVRTLVFESVVTSRIGYVPFVEWYTTDVQSRVMDY